MYMIQIGHVVYDAHRGGRPFTLVDAVHAVYGVRYARVLRTDGTVVVSNAGSCHEVTHAPTGRIVRRRTVPAWRPTPVTHGR
jgi:hypothetical protein